ncbi:MAG: glycosyltransferase [Vicinamibacterales bacterium]
MPARTDIVVGIGSYNCAATIGAVARAVRQGLDRQFGAGAGCLVLADGGSTDRTADEARAALAGSGDFLAVEYAAPPVDPLKPPYHGLAGRPEAIRAILTAARDRGAAACAFVDAGVTTLLPDWIPRLIQPALESEFDYVSPFYLRHPFEGALTKSIVYPTFRALYGVRLRQPAAGEFGCSLRLARHWLEQPIWDGEEAQAGIDLWLATTAVAGGFRPCEAVLGVREHRSAAPAPDLSVTLEQVAGALFTDMEARSDVWQRVRGSAAVPAIGDPPPGSAAAPDLNVERLVDAFRLGYRALRDIWAWVVPPRTILTLKKMTELPIERFRLEDDLWAQIVYDFALAHRVRSMPRDHLLRAMTPLYLGWLASFAVGCRGAAPDVPDERLEQLNVAFETRKSYLISRWRWPEQFRS